MEKIINKRLLLYLENNNMISPNRVLEQNTLVQSIYHCSRYNYKCIPPKDEECVTHGTGIQVADSKF